MNEIAINDTVKFIAEALVKVMGNVVEVAQALVKAIDTIPDFEEKLLEYKPELDSRIIKNFERIGRRQMVASLMWDATPGGEALRRLPFSLQEKYHNQSVPVVVQLENGWETLDIEIKNLSKNQSDQVFNHETIRNEGQQRAFIEDRRAKIQLKTAHASEPYRITGKELIVLTQCKFTASELISILNRISK